MALRVRGETVDEITGAVRAIYGGDGKTRARSAASEGSEVITICAPAAVSAGLAAGTLQHCGHIGRLGEYAEAAAAYQTAVGLHPEVARFRDGLAAALSKVE